MIRCMLNKISPGYCFDNHRFQSYERSLDFTNIQSSQYREVQRLPKTPKPRKNGMSECCYFIEINLVPFDPVSNHK